MELDLSFLQLTFNVITVTAIPSLAMNCYLLRRDKEKLVTAILNSPLQLDPHHPENPKSAPSTAASKVPPAPAVVRTDIRQFVTQRSSNWVAPSKSQWNARRPALSV